MPRVYGLGDPVLDIVVRVDDALLQQLRAEPGGCVPVTAGQMAALLALPEVQADVMRVPGGSAANVMKGLASLGRACSGESADGAAHAVDTANGTSKLESSTDDSGAGASLAVLFVGMVGSDDVAEEYRRSIAAHGVQPVLLQRPHAAAAGDSDASAAAAATATCLCLVTPDGQRTMRTCLGAAVDLSDPAQLPAPLRGAAPADEQQPRDGSAAEDSWALLHCEGYCLYRSAVAAAAMRAAHAAGARVSLDLASFEVIHNCWAQLDGLLQDRLVDIVFCNEQEAEALCQAASLAVAPEGGPEQAVAAAQGYLLSRGASVVVVSRGSKGCVARSADGGVAQAAASKVSVVDTVGAGDFFTAGFLFALLQGASLTACAQSGCTAGTAAVQVAGAELGPAVLRQLRASIAAILQAAGEEVDATASDVRAAAATRSAPAGAAK